MENVKPFIESDHSAPAQQLRQTMSDLGYLFFRRLLVKDRVREVRRAILELCSEAGWLEPGTTLMDGIANTAMPPLTERHELYRQVYRKVLRLPVFHNFPLCDPLMHVAHALLGTDVMAHPRRIGRITFPNFTQATTPPHQDYHYIRGAEETYSCWVPLGNCPVELGGLAVWPGTQQRGFLEHSEHLPDAVGGAGVPVNESEAVWHTGDFEIGDALFFHSFTIHKALPNLSGNRLRVSTDNRYQRPGDDIADGSLKPHLNLEE